MTSTSSEELEQPFISHLIELRSRLIRAILAIFALFIPLAFFAQELYTFLAGPLLAHLPAGGSLIATEVASPFITPFKLAFIVAIFAAMPIILYQLWAFIAPGLYSHERKLALPLLVSSVILFYCGAAVAYYGVLPAVFYFITKVAPQGVAVMTDISKYLDFVLTVFFAFGLAFEIPIATILLILAGITTPESLTAKRPYIIVGAFVVGAIVTPPDVISQVVFAVLILVLFEAGLFVSRYFVRIQEQAREEREQGEAEMDHDAAMERALDQAIAEQDALEKKRES